MSDTDNDRLRAELVAAILAEETRLRPERAAEVAERIVDLLRAAPTGRRRRREAKK